MSRIFIADREHVDPEVLELLKTLPDNYWVLAEVDVGRNLDWVIMRSLGAEPAVLIAAEQKRVTRAITGQANGPWYFISDDGSVGDPIEPANPGDVNYYRQSINAGNALKKWMWNNQRLFLDEQYLRGEDEFRVWPDLLVLSPVPVSHRLPLGPPSNYGRWWTDSDDWIAHVLSWRPRFGVPLADREILRMIQSLGLTQVWGPDLNGLANSTSGSDCREYGDSADADRDNRATRNRLNELEDRVRVIERALGRSLAENAKGAQPFAEVVERPLTGEESEALVRAVQKAHAAGKSRAVPTILEYWGRELGYSLTDTAYNGFRTAGAMLASARAQGIIKFGPKRGPNPTIFLPSEEV